ncbi:hypothetical protein H9655_11330 [Cytobacillus sp. Sa5YUA1]|uniref:Uncharacterized protein n=2 Tax=Bacillaceae TaxID=186817 RepID=A0ABR8QPZ7_9BACI|nr:hypothetical protein [Cytobacillus stercorigallinarum]MBD7937616.1 hypothetical protein [Cytobacillus stercorigallinarum]
MGIYIGLDIIPNHINQEDWQKVFEETLQLIQAYPFATLNVDSVNGFMRFVLDRTERQNVEGYGSEAEYWKINGDLESKETGESFTLFSSLDRYSRLKEERAKEDILLNFLNKNERGAREVFYSKTQGKDYHIYLLAIAALIESRFPKFACVYGDISKDQAQNAVNWANSILEKPIDLPVRVNPSKLLERLEVIGIEEKQLEALYDLSIGASEEVDGLVGKHFNMNTIRNYFSKELQDFKSPVQLGAELVIIRFLNAGLPLEILTDICCFDNNGPKFEPIEFTKAICSTWVMIEPDTRANIGIANEVPETVESQFGNMFLDMGYMGRRTRRYVPKEKVISVLKGKLGDNNQFVQTIEAKYQDIVKMLKEKGRKLKEIEDDSYVKLERDVIYAFDELLYWNDQYEISESIMNIITTVKEAVEDSLSKRSDLMQLIGEVEEQGQLIKVLSQIIQEHQNLVLTRASWDWIENEATNVIKQMVVMLLTFENYSELRKLFRAYFENKGLFNKYMK